MRGQTAASGGSAVAGRACSRHARAIAPATRRRRAGWYRPGRDIGAVGAGRGRRPWVRSVEVVPQDVGPGRVAQVGHVFGLDLPDALPGDPVDLADLVE